MFHLSQSVAVIHLSQPLAVFHLSQSVSIILQSQSVFEKNSHSETLKTCWDGHTETRETEPSKTDTNKTETNKTKTYKTEISKTVTSKVRQAKLRQAKLRKAKPRHAEHKKRRYRLWWNRLIPDNKKETETLKTYFAWAMANIKVQLIFAKTKLKQTQNRFENENQKEIQ